MQLFPARPVLLGLTAIILMLSGCAKAPDPPPPAAAPQRDFPAVILNGDFPDPSIVREGSDFYLTHSSFNAVPGLPIWHSKNLREWTMITRALKKHVGNVWAPEIITHEGQFYIYFPAAGTNWVITAKSPVGPWSEPVDLKVGGIDPGHVVGRDGKRYLHLSGGRAVALADDGLSVEGEATKVYDGWEYPEDWVVECFCLESPKLAFRQGRYYMTSAQGGTAGPATSHMVVSARSENPLGPWENSPHNPILRTESAAEKWWSRGHGTIFDGGEDEWYMVYHAFEKGFRTMGRQVLIDRIEWDENGWFRIPASEEPFDPRVIENHKLESDDFTGAELKLQWQLDGSQLAPEFVLEEGVLTLPSLAKRLTVLYAQAADHNYEASVRLEPSANAEAGLAIYYGPQSFIGIGNDGKDAVLFRAGEAETGRGVDCPDCRHFKLRVEDQALRFFYSRDGQDWTPYPLAFDVTAFQGNPRGGFPAAKVAIFARGKGTTRVDDFRYERLR